ncbi:ABC transporter permease [Calditrichota bacterium LG25]
MLFALAWKNIWRNKTRSLIVILAIAFGLWGGLFSGGLMVALGDSMVKSAIDRDLAHIQIHHPKFDENKSIQRFIPQAEEILLKLKTVQGLAGISARMRFLGMASSATSSYPVQICGINAQQEKGVTTIYQRLVAGNYLNSPKENAIVIGQKLAQRLNLRLHSKLVLGFEGLDGELINVACRIVGIYRTESSRFDESHVFLKSEFLVSNIGRPAIHEIAIRLKDSGQLTKKTNLLKSWFPDLLVESWKERSPETAFIADMMILYTYFFLVFILFAVLFGITNTMFMSVVDRVRELGMLMAIGMKRIRVFTMILLESIMLSITGGFVGVIIGGLTIFLTNHTGINLTIFKASLEFFGSSSVLYPTLPAELYAYLTILIIFTASAAAIMPAIKAVRLEPARAIRTL